MTRTLRTAVGAITLYAAAGFLAPGAASAHCEIPCGIYGDAMRFDMIEENLVTVEKSMQQIAALSGDPAANANQLVRWVQNKEHHADRIRDIAVQYFLTQRVKPGAEGDAAEQQRYVDMLVHLHAIIQHAMKAKQTLDVSHVEKIREHTEAFRASYMREEAKEHLKEHRGAEGAKAKQN
jgi:nickel superoxide dismutase